MANYNIESMLYDFIIDNNIATEKEVNLVTDISGYSEETMNDIIFARTGNRDYEQCKDDGYIGTDELDEYYDLNEDDGYIGTDELDEYYDLNEDDEDDEDEDEEDEDE